MLFRPKNKLSKIQIGSLGSFLDKLGFGFSTFTISPESLKTHMYVVGRSGKGKSKFLEGFLWQLMQSGYGCGLIDPHGDLADNLLKLISSQPLDKNGRTWLSNEKKRLSPGLRRACPVRLLPHERSD